MIRPSTSTSEKMIFTLLIDIVVFYMGFTMINVMKPNIKELFQAFFLDIQTWKTI